MCAFHLSCEASKVVGCSPDKLKLTPKPQNPELCGWTTPLEPFRNVKNMANTTHISVELKKQKSIATRREKLTYILM